jgi:Activator of Hsp90 ATPase homolog 1-like protein
MEPLRTFSFRWHPAAIDPAVDYSAEPTTLVVFRLEEVQGGTQLTVVESGFDGIPLERRTLAFRLNDGGWAAQMLSIERHVAATG